MVNYFCIKGSNLIWRGKEGHPRKSRKEFLLFLNIAKGSLEDLKYFIILSADLNYISKVQQDKLEELSEEVSKTLYSFTKNLNAESWLLNVE